MPAYQPALRVPVERVGVDVDFGVVLQIVGVEADAMEVLNGTPHLVNGEVVSRGVLERAAAPGKVYVLRPRVVRLGIEVAVRGEHSLDTDVFAHELSDVVVGAHEAAFLVQAKTGAELYGESGKVLDVGLEIGDGKDDALGNEFLRAQRESKRE